MRIDVSVSGSIFSGDGLFYPHSTLPSALAEENYMDYNVDATFATYTVVLEVGVRMPKMVLFATGRSVMRAPGA